MMIMIDELVNIYKVPNSITRQYNYEKLLTMYNDTLQGKAKYLGIIMRATPQAIEDNRRGVYSYEALRSRLAEGKFSKPGARDLLAPVIRLDPITAEEMLILCEKLTVMHAGLYGYERKITTDDLAAFIKIEYERIGADVNITPREVIRDFIELLDILYQNPGMSITGVLNSVRPYYLQFTMQASEQDFYRIAAEEAAHDFDPLELVYEREIPVFDKYDEYAPAELVRKGFAFGVLDIKGMKQRVPGWKENAEYM